MRIIDRDINIYQSTMERYHLLKNCIPEKVSYYEALIIQSEKVLKELKILRDLMGEEKIK